MEGKHRCIFAQKFSMFLHQLLMPVPKTERAVDDQPPLVDYHICSLIWLPFSRKLSFQLLRNLFLNVIKYTVQRHQC